MIKIKLSSSKELMKYVIFRESSELTHVLHLCRDRLFIIYRDEMIWSDSEGMEPGIYEYDPNYDEFVKVSCDKIVPNKRYILVARAKKLITDEYSWDERWGRYSVIK